MSGSPFGARTSDLLNVGSMDAYLPPDAVAGPLVGIEPLPQKECHGTP